MKKSVKVKKSIGRSIVATLFFGLMATFVMAQPAGAMEELMQNMQGELDLSDKQLSQMQNLMGEFSDNLDVILTKYEGEEEPDMGKMIGEIKDAQENYQDKLQGVMSKDQYAIYQTKVNEILTQMFYDLAEIRLMDAQPVVDLTDKQIVQLTPIVGTSMMQTVHLVFNNAGGRLSIPKKVSLSKQMKKIEKEKRSQMENILTPDQLAAYDTFREEQKKKK